MFTRQNKSLAKRIVISLVAIVVVAAVFGFISVSVKALGFSSDSYNMSVVSMDAMGGGAFDDRPRSGELLDYFVTGQFTGDDYIVKAGFLYFKPPNAPAIGTPESLSTSSIKWNFTDQSGDEEGFLLEDQNEDATLVRAEANIGSLTETGLVANQKYTRRVLAFNVFGNSLPSDYVSDCTLVGSRTLSGSPGTTYMDLTLGTFPRSSTGLSGYYFRRSGGAASGWQSGINTWRNTGLSVNTQYTWAGKVRGICGDESAETFLTACTAANVPGQPKISFDKIAGIYVATVSFSANGNPIDTEYAITVNGSYLQSDGSVGGTPAWSTSLSRRHVGLNVGKIYVYRVVARNCDDILTEFSLSNSLLITGIGPDEKPEGLLDTIPKLIIAFLEKIIELLGKFRDNSLTQLINQVGIVPALAVLAFANLLAAAGLANIGSFLGYLWQFFTEPFLFFAGRRRRFWGVVYNSLTKVPVDLALVRLLDAETGQLVSTRVTDRKGRFAFMTKTGKFKITVVKTEFTFPSQKVVGKTHDAGFDDLYFGEDLEIATNKTVINVSVPVDPVVAVEAVKTGKQAISNYLRRRLSFVIALIGPILGAVCVWISPNIYTFALLLIHIIIFVFFFRIVMGKKGAPWGTVYDTKSGKPVGLAIVRIFSKKYGDLLETQVTDRRGRFGFMVGSETYNVTADKSTYKFPSRVDRGFGKYRGEDFTVRGEGMVQFDIPLDPTTGDASLPTSFGNQESSSGLAKESREQVEEKKKLDLGELGGKDS